MIRSYFGSSGATSNYHHAWRVRNIVSASAILVLWITVALTSSCVREDDLTADQRVYQLSQQLMCPVCDGQTLDQSQAQLSEDMKAVIRWKVEEGDSNQQIRDYFVERYGEIVLAAPDAGGFNLIAWVMPAVIFIAGALLVGNAFLNMRRRNSANSEVNDEQTSSDADLAEQQSASDEETDEYLERAEREIASAIGETKPLSRSRLDTRDNQ